MSDSDALLASIFAAPDDDAPRLIFADWLDEQGESERAEFIRASIIVGRHTDCPIRITDEARGRPIPLRCGACAYCKARRRCDELSSRVYFCPELEAYSYLHDAPTPYDPPHLPGPGFHLTIRRGFVDAVECAAADLLAHFDAVVAAHPVQEVRLTDYPVIDAVDVADGGYTVQLRGGRATIRSDYGALYEDSVCRLLRAQWPSVKTWHLPTEVGREDMRRELERARRGGYILVVPIR